MYSERNPLVSISFDNIPLALQKEEDNSSIPFKDAVERLLAYSNHKLGDKENMSDQTI